MKVSKKEKIRIDEVLERFRESFPSTPFEYQFDELTDIHFLQYNPIPKVDIEDYDNFMYDEVYNFTKMNFDNDLIITDDKILVDLDTPTYIGESTENMDTPVSDGNWINASDDQGEDDGSDDMLLAA